MIITRTPLRISLFGGGTDFKQYYEKKVGKVVSFTIDKSVYVSVNKRFDGDLHLRYSTTEVVKDVNDLKHDIVRECLKAAGISKGVEIVIMSDVPSVGTGLGSSSALAVGLLKALYRYNDMTFSKEALAEEACYIEIERVGSLIGKQDQYACAKGGFNYFIFSRSGDILSVSLYDRHKSKLDNIMSYVSLFYMPRKRNSNIIFKEHVENICKDDGFLDENIKLAERFLDIVYFPIYDIREIGDMLSKSWEIKKHNSSASDDFIDKVFAVAKENGAWGGKICGIGGGGFMVLVGDKEYSYKLDRAMESMGLRKTEFKFYPKGSEVIYED